MSKLADLLNPAPSNVSRSPTRPTISTSNSPHKRNESITSPLEALALAASTSTPATQSRSAVASPSFPPNPYLNTNPYAIKPQQSPPASKASGRPDASEPSHSPPATVKSPDPTKKSIADAPSDSLAAMQAQEKEATAQPIVKTELSDEPAVVSATVDITPVKMEGADAVSKVPNEDVEMKEDRPAEPKPVKEVKKTTAATKKGTAKAKKDTGDSATIRKPTIKKRKLEIESKDGTPFSQRSGTPNSRASKTPAQRRTPQQSPGPTSLSINGDDYDDASEGDGEVFCICRRPDDHTWMIACDGGCDDWFHGKCVRMNEADGNLIDKYICPNCESAGRGKTMWKPMCRLPGCREPARVAGKKPSKYCSDEHGVQFMREMAAGKFGKNSKQDDSRKRRKAAKDADHEAEISAALKGDDSDDGHQAHLRGGVLKPGELKALVSSVKTAEEFKKLGEKSSLADSIAKKPSPKPKVDTNGDVKMEDDDGDDEPEIAVPKLDFTEQEQAALDVAAKQRANLNSKLALLADRDKLLAMVKARHKSVLDDLRKKDKAVKDICGYDSRLGWDDGEFDEWRNTEEGKAALASNTLPAPPKRKPEETNGNGTAGEDEEEVGRGVCKRKRCERHKTWAKLSQQEINLARSQCWHQMRKIDRDEEELKERALMRQREGR